MVVPTGSPLNYPTNSQPVLQRVSDRVPPTSSNYKNFRLGDEWLDTTASIWYKLADITGTTATWVSLGSGGAGSVNTFTTADLNVVTPVANNVDFANGAGISITGSGDTITITNTSTTGVVWSVITAATKTIVVNEAYFANRGAGVTFTLPATAVVGDQFCISSISAGGWTIGQSAGQSIRLGSSLTTPGGGGSLASTAIGDSVCVVCAVANTDFIAINGTGNITIV